MRFSFFIFILLLFGSHVFSQDSAKIYSKKGEMAKESRDYKSAIDCFTKAISFDPENASFYSNRGDCYRDIKIIQKAINDYTQARKINPDVPYYLRERAVLYKDLKNYKKAIADYDTCIRIAKFGILLRRYYFERGVTQLLIGEYQFSATSITMAMRYEDYDPWWDRYYFRGLAYYHLNRYDEAIADYDKAQSLILQQAGGETLPETDYKADALKKKSLQ